MKILKYLLYTVVILAALIAALGFFAKKTYHIERSIDIDAPKSLVFESVSQFKNVDKWSPWNELDPNMKKTFSATDGTVGASFSWSGNEDVGAGKQTIQAIGADRVDILLNISEPFKADFPASFTLSGDDQKTKITWIIDPVLPFPINVWAMFTNIDRAMGKDYDRGLGNLKKHCEAIVHPKYRGFEVTETELPLMYYVGVRAQTDTAQIPEFYATNLPKALEAVTKAGLQPGGPPSGLFWTWQNGMSDMAAAVPTAEVKKYADDIESFPVGGGLALVINYFGPYAGTGEAHLALDDYMLEKNLVNIPPVIEAYVTDPATEPDTAKWLTKVIYFVKPKVDSTVIK
ncbi:MAG: SRPBCC family protein [Saprospiraceae bacterium]|nr:SRPBCC family protein [Saprospiraceae bacterium]